MDEPRCDFSDLPVSSCAHCTGRTGDEPATSGVRIVAVWDARYAGRCDWCDHWFNAGERIGKDEHGSYVCSRHPEVSSG